MNVKLREMDTSRVLGPSGPLGYVSSHSTPNNRHMATSMKNTHTFTPREGGGERQGNVLLCVL